MIFKKELPISINNPLLSLTGTTSKASVIVKMKIWQIVTKIILCFILVQGKPKRAILTDLTFSSESRDFEPESARVKHAALEEPSFFHLDGGFSKTLEVELENAERRRHHLDQDEPMDKNKAKRETAFPAVASAVKQECGDRDVKRLDITDNDHLPIPMRVQSSSIKKASFIPRKFIRN